MQILRERETHFYFYNLRCDRSLFGVKNNIITSIHENNTPHSLALTLHD